LQGQQFKVISKCYECRVIYQRAIRLHGQHF
jgi:hypothetical protein